MRILAVSGSLREDSFNTSLLRAALEAAPEGVELELWEGIGELPFYSGHSTFWGNFNINNKNSNDTFTGSIHVRGTDGSYITYHEVAHETFDQNGDPVVQIDRPTSTCG